MLLDILETEDSYIDCASEKVILFVTVRVTCTSYDVSICKYVSNTHVESPY